MTQFLRLLKYGLADYIKVDEFYNDSISPVTKIKFL